jgi:hypothetical protein
MLRSGPNWEPKQSASGEQLLGAIEKRFKVASKKPKLLARERLRIARGLVGPIADHLASQALDATSQEITDSPSLLNFDEHFARRSGAGLPTAMLAAIRAQSVVSEKSRSIVLSAEQKSSLYRRTKELVAKSKAVFFDDMGASIVDGVTTAFSFPLNTTATRLFRQYPSIEWEEVEKCPPGKFLECLRSVQVGEAISTAVLAPNGYWRSYSNEVGWGFHDVVGDRESAIYTDKGEDVSPSFRRNLIRLRRLSNDRALKAAHPKNDFRISSGCPVAQPHVGPPNLYERAGIAVLRSLDASDLDICNAMRGNSISRGIALGERICELVRDNEMGFPSDEYVNAKQLEWNKEYAQLQNPQLVS